MTTCDEIDSDKPGQPSLIRLVLFFVMQGVAVILVGFAALFLSFEPGWSAERVQAAFVKPGEARSGSLLIKTDDGYADASRLGIDVDLTVSGPTVRARVTQIFRNPTKDWVEAEARRRGSTAEEQLLAIFDLFDEWFQRGDFEGCSFINVLLEMNDRGTPIGGASAVHLANIRSIIETLAREADLRDPEQFAHSWHILMKGSIVAAGEGDSQAAKRAQAMGRLLIAQHRPA